RTPPDPRPAERRLDHRQIPRPQRARPAADGGPGHGHRGRDRAPHRPWRAGALPGPADRDRGIAHQLHPPPGRGRRSARAGRAGRRPGLVGRSGSPATLADMSSTNTSPAVAAPFAVVRKGFDQKQVADALARHDAEAEVLRADRDAAVDRAERASAEAARERERAASLEARVAELGRAPVTTAQVSDRVSTMLTVATAEAESIRDSAHATADQIRADADEEAWTLRESARRAAETDRGSATAELTAARERAAAVRAEHTEILESARKRAAEILAAAERERQRLDLEASRAREEIDEDHRLASDARRRETRLEDERRPAASVSAAEATRRAADEDARQPVDEATERAEPRTRARRGAAPDPRADHRRTRRAPCPSRIDPRACGRPRRRFSGRPGSQLQRRVTPRRPRPAQHPVCQCRRSSSPRGRSGHATT